VVRISECERIPGFDLDTVESEGVAEEAVLNQVINNACFILCEIFCVMCKTIWNLDAQINYLKKKSSWLEVSTIQCLYCY
jgi:hypothetical protein